MQDLTLNQNPTRGMTRGSILSMWIPTPSFPPQRSIRRNQKIQRKRSAFHSQMWVKGSPLQFIVYSGSHKNLILVEVMKQLGLSTIAHLQPYTIGWLHQGWDLCINQQCRLPYSIKPFTEKVLSDIAPLDVFDVLLGQPYLWKRHVVYDSRLHVVIITLGNNLYRIWEIAPPTSISLVTAKQCRNLIAKTRKFVFLMIRPQGKKNIVAMTSRQGPSAHDSNRWIRSWRSTRTYSPPP
jgi:hypothetical protein